MAPPQSTPAAEKPTAPEQIESFLVKMETAEKPWFLCSTMIYGWVKATAASIPHSQMAFDQSIRGITALTTYIKEKTNANVLVLDLDKASELISKLDGVLSDLFIRLDDGFDTLRGKLGLALRQLISSLVKHKQIALDFLAKKVAQLNQAGEAGIIAAKTRYEQALEVFSSLLCAAKEKYQPYYATLEAKKTELTLFVDESLKTKSAEYYSALFKASTYLLKTAQPYVHDALARSSPYIAQAVEVSQPYVVQAKPYLEPLLLKAQTVKSSLQGNSVVGPYVTRAEQLVLEIGSTAFEEAKIYCCPAEEKAAASLDVASSFSTESDILD